MGGWIWAVQEPLPFTAPRRQGTGKTTAATKLISKAADQHGPENVFVTSFTKAAAREIASRAMEGVQAGTLHSHCFHALDRPKIAEACVAKVPNGWVNPEGMNISPWNNEFPNYALSDTKGAADDPFAERGGGEGDEMMALYQRYRAMMIPKDVWMVKVRNFADNWEDWKRQHGLMDFTDLIEVAIKEVPYAPGAPAVGFVDEAQDMTPLQMRLIEQWAQFMSSVVLLGDDDQILYAWAGCTPETLVNAPVEQTHVLKQSYRVPRRVQVLAERWISNVKVRKPKEYRHRDAEGHVIRSGANFRNPMALVNDAIEHVHENETIMFLASCGYMLWPTLELLKDNGIPFHNPYRERSPAWNPFHSATGNTPAEKLLMFLRPNEDIWGQDARMWSYKELAIWTEPLQAKGIIKHGKKSVIKEMKSQPGLVTWNELAEWFEESVLNDLYECRPDWYSERTLAKFSKSLDYPLKVLSKFGPRGLLETPQVCVGTIHSVKGGEADRVYLFPDLSNPGYENWNGDDKDSIYRLGYVAVTRARDSVVLASAASHMAWEGL